MTEAPVYAIVDCGIGLDQAGRMHVVYQIQTPFGTLQFPTNADEADAFAAKVATIARQVRSGLLPATTMPEAAQVPLPGLGPPNGRS